MHIINQTRFSTLDLQKFFVAGLKAMSASTSKTITVTMGRGSYFTGKAKYGSSPERQGRLITMRIPPRSDMQPSKDRASLARVFEHEVYHTLGVRHGEMSADVLYCKGDLPDWAQRLPIRKAESKPKPKATSESKTIIKLEHARKMMLNHRRHLKREQNLVTKWRRKARYHEKRLALVAGRVKP